MNKRYHILIFSLVLLKGIAAFSQSIPLISDSVKVASFTVKTPETIPTATAIQVSDSTIIITLADGTTASIAYTPGTPMQITDAAGSRYTIDQDGKVTQEYNAADAPDPLQAGDSIDYDYVFEQSNEGKGGFDDYADVPTALNKYYEYTTINGKQYMMSWKAVATNQSGEVNISSPQGDFPTTVGFQLTPDGEEGKPISAQDAGSVDHLESIGDAEIDALKNTKVMPTLLPGAAFFLRMSYPPARKMIEAGLPVALATDYNPGSAPCGKMALMLYFGMCANENDAR